MVLLFEVLGREDETVALANFGNARTARFFSLYRHINLIIVPHQACILKIFLDPILISIFILILILISVPPLTLDLLLRAYICKLGGQFECRDAC